MAVLDLSLLCGTPQIAAQKNHTRSEGARRRLQREHYERMHIILKLSEILLFQRNGRALSSTVLQKAIEGYKISSNLKKKKTLDSGGIDKNASILIRSVQKTKLNTGLHHLYRIKSICTKKI